MLDAGKSHDPTELDNPTGDDDRQSWWHRRSTASTVATGIAAAVALAGIGWLTTVEPAPAATDGTPIPATAAATSASTIVTVFESDLRDPTRLQSIFTDSHIPAVIQLVHVPLIDGVIVAGCDGPAGDRLPQIRDVLGKEPGLLKMGDRKGLRIDTAAIPRGAVLRFVYWIEPGSTTPSLPTIVLFQGTPPTCTPMSAVPTIPPKPGPG